ncbi:MAG: response regulator transcription factor [Proteobacteria bacterium]|nr:MAG: response regulator transcription factor [Pseudomonadota bacterium]
MRVLISSEQVMVGEGLRLLIESKFGLEVVGDITPVSEIEQRALALLPDIVLLDATIEEESGISGVLQQIERTKASCPTVQFLALSPYKDEVHLRLAFAAGVSGFLLKTSTAQRLRNALRIIHYGGIYIDPTLGQKPEGNFIHSDAGWFRLPSLTSRELEVLILLAWGYTMVEIARKLGLSENTVKSQKRRALRKCGLHSGPEITAYALRRDWLA